MNIQHYLKYKSFYEALLWSLFIIWQLFANIYVALDDTANSGAQRWEPVLWESSSTVMLAFLVPLILVFDRRYPIHFASLKVNLPIYPSYLKMPASELSQRFQDKAHLRRNVITFRTSVTP